jgi:hypothetical protein
VGEPADEARIAAIVAEGRATRRRPSRSTWIAAAIVSALCAIGFVLLLGPVGAPGDPAGAGGSAEVSREGAREAPRRAARGLGCAGGLGLGLGIGLALGFALGRRQAGARDHSSRSSP